MAGTFSCFVGTRGQDVWGHYKNTPFVYTGPAAYVTGGETIAPNLLKLGTIEWMTNGVGINALATLGVLFIWNPTTAKLQAFWGNAGSASALPEVAADTVLNGYRALILAFGKG